jgi:hypothetical protein
MLVQCPTCKRTHRSTRTRVRWYCVECGTMWDGSGRVVTGRHFPRNTVQRHPKTDPSSTAERPESKPGEKRIKLWDVEVL